MIDYRLRVYRRFPQKQMRQVVLYLRETTSELVYQNRFTLSHTHHEFDIVRLWEQSTEIFFQTPDLLPFAVLSSTNNPEDVLIQVANALETIPDPKTRQNVTASSAILAGLILDRDRIQSILRKEPMKESVIYQDILKEGRAEALEQVALKLLGEGLSVEQVQGLQQREQGRGES